MLHGCQLSGPESLESASLSLGLDVLSHAPVLGFVHVSDLLLGGQLGVSDDGVFVVVEAIASEGGLHGCQHRVG